MAFPLDSLVDVIRDLTTASNGTGAMRTAITQSTLTTGAKSSISTSAVQMTSTSIACRRGVLVKAAAGNSGKVYVGPSGVTAATSDSTDGMELAAGDSVFVEVTNANVVYCIGSASSQKVFWVAL